jgi:hypothetical protein
LYREVGRQAQYSPEEIEEYGMHLRHISLVLQARRALKEKAAAEKLQNASQQARPFPYGVPSPMPTWAPDRLFSDLLRFPFGS